LKFGGFENTFSEEMGAKSVRVFEKLDTFAFAKEGILEPGV